MRLDVFARSRPMKPQTPVVALSSVSTRKESELIAIVDELQAKIGGLQAKIDALTNERGILIRKVAFWRTRAAILERKVIAVGNFDKVTMAAIISVTATQFNVARNEMMSQRRKANLVRARQTVMYLAKELTERSMPEIGKILKRDHTTVMHGISKISSLIAVDPELRAKVARIRTELVA